MNIQLLILDYPFSLSGLIFGQKHKAGGKIRRGNIEVGIIFGENAGNIGNRVLCLWIQQSS